MMVNHQDALVEELLSKPVGPVRPPSDREPDFTREIEVSGDTVTAVIRDEAGAVTEGKAYDFLTEEGLNPADWEVATFRKSQWGDPLDPRESVRFTFRRVGSHREAIDLSELIARVKSHEAAPEHLPVGPTGALFDMGDMQFGKADGDGVAGTLRRAISVINKGADRIASLQKFGTKIGHIEVGFLGDHVEGFVSQNGANAWRTDLSLNEQIRLTRRTMLHALEVFSPLAEQVSMVAVPGNHGEAIRFNGKGVTRYDDSHDTESLIAVADAAKYNPDRFGHVKFYVPQTDELTVVTEVAGTVIAYAHGHQWRPGKHFEWWRGQAFNVESQLKDAHLMVAGHGHHEVTDTDGYRTFTQTPALESESTWWRHAKGTTGAPGALLMLTQSGFTDYKEIIR